MKSMGVQPGQVVSDPYARAFAPHPQVETIVKEEEDHEVSMAQNQLDSIIKAATELKSKIGESEKDIPAWIQDHITNSENYINQAASNYHEYNTNESINEFQTGFSNKKIDAKIIADRMRKYPETKSFADKIEKLKMVSAQDLDKMLPDFVSGGVITKIFKESVNEARLTSIVKSIVETPVIGKMVGSRVNEVVYNIGAGYMGNGLTIWNRAVKENGDYKIIAHIDPYGKISIRDKAMPAKIKSMIEDWAEALKKGDN